MTDLLQYSIREISEKLRKKEISSVELTQKSLERIQKTEPQAEAFLTVCEEHALEQAKKADETLASGSASSVLTGIPMAVKDNICTKGIRTTCASKMLEHFIPPYDASVMERLNEANAVMVGKVNLDEFAMGSSTENSYYKKTKNPHDLTRVPGGSSGGSAASVGFGEVFYALGSDTGGSIRQPAAYCGVVGLKPTYGLVSRYGLVAFASSLDQIGPLANRVEDCAFVLENIAGKDPRDATSVDRGQPDFSSALGESIRGLRIGIPKEYFGGSLNPEIKEKVLNAVKELEKQGAELVDISLKELDYALPVYYIISSAEASSNLARYDGVKYGYRAAEFDNLIDMYRKSRTEGFGDEVKRRIMLGTYVLSSGYYDAYYKKAQQVRTLIQQSFVNRFEQVDVIITPTVPNEAFHIGEKTDNPTQMYLEDIYTVSINIAGLPAISVPCGKTASNMPVGMQIIGKHFDEKTILKVGYLYEQIRGAF